MVKDEMSFRQLIWLKCYEIGRMSAMPFHKFNWHVLARLVRAVTSPNPAEEENPFITEVRNAIYRRGHMPSELSMYNPGQAERNMFLTQDELDRAG